jgi:hypothetical protein
MKQGSEQRAVTGDWARARKGDATERGSEQRGDG